ncbi:MAG: glycosyltransferase [Acidobacteria bacterium]|nr:glycosyltransferase [Acidobacteriota bacterium]
MQLSVIIPALNEAGRIGRTVRGALVPGVAEVLVVDGGSRDGTAEEAAAAGARVLTGVRGRGPQQNAGAREAVGETLLFLHADTTLPPDFPQHVERTLAAPGVAAGAFRFRLDEPGYSLRLVEWMVNRRSHLLQMPYGDQGIFLRRATFEQAGGFPEAPLLEDYELIRRLRRLGRIGIAPAPVVTSSRRWRRLGVWRTTWSNQMCLLAYWLDVSPERIARWRGAQ